MTFIFRNRTIFWDISKWNRRQKKWDGGSISYASSPPNTRLLSSTKLFPFFATSDKGCITERLSSYHYTPS